MILFLLLLLLFCVPGAVITVILVYGVWLFVNALGWLFIAVLAAVAALLVLGLGMEPDAALLVAAVLVVGMGAAVSIHNDPEYPDLFSWSRGS